MTETSAPIRSRRIGSKTNAELISKFYPIWYTREWCDLNDRDYTQSGEELLNDDQLPEGFIYLAAGVSRMAFLGPDGKVYKIPRYKRAENTCITEHQRYLSHGREWAAKGIFLAKSFWDKEHSVLVMEYCPKSRDYTGAEYDRISTVTQLWDIHSGNAWVDPKGRLVLIDYAT